MKYFLPQNRKNNFQGLLASGIASSGDTLTIEAESVGILDDTINGTATSDGTSILLNQTGIGDLDPALTAFDVIYNITQDAIAIIRSVATDSVSTTPLINQAGEDVSWSEDDVWCVGAIELNLSKRSADGKTINSSENILFTEISGNTFKTEAKYRAYGGEQSSFDVGDYIASFDTEKFSENIKNYLALLTKKLDDIANQGFTFKGSKNFAEIPTSDGTPSNPTDLITKNYFEENGSAGGVLSGKLCAEDLPVNKAVFLDDDGRLRECEEGGDSDLGLSISNLRSACIRQLSGERYLFTWVESSTGKIQLADRNSDGSFTLVGNVLSLGTVALQSVYLTKISATKCRSFSHTDSQTSATIYCKVVNISGDTISFGTTNNFSTSRGTAYSYGKWNHNDNGDVCLMSAGHNGTYYLQTAHIIEGEFSHSERVGLLGKTDSELSRSQCSGKPFPLANDRWLIVLDGSSTNLHVGIISSGSSGIESLTLTKASAVAKHPQICPFGNDKYLICHQYGNFIVNCTDTAISQASAGHIGYTPNFHGGAIYEAHLFADNMALVLTTAGGSTPRVQKITRIDDDNVEIEDNYMYVSGWGGSYARNIIFLSSIEAVFAQRTTNYGAFTFKINTQEKAIGATRQSRLEDQTMDITTLGGIHNTESGLTLGQDYKINNIVFGKIVSATEALFDNPPRTNNN